MLAVSAPVGSPPTTVSKSNRRKVFRVPLLPREGVVNFNSTIRLAHVKYVTEKEAAA